MIRLVSIDFKKEGITERYDDLMKMWSSVLCSCRLPQSARKATYVGQNNNISSAVNAHGSHHETNGQMEKEIEFTLVTSHSAEQ